MRASERIRLKLAVDAHVREQIRIARGGNFRQACVGCGGPIEGNTTGCIQCGDRRRRRTYREAVAIPTGEQLINRDGQLHAQITATHGTETGYGLWKCRCQECRAAAASARRRRRRRPNVNKHGHSGYCNGCRCKDCREGYREHNRERARLKKAAA